MKTSPTYFVMLSFLISAFYFGFTIRISESPIDRPYSVNGVKTTPTPTLSVYNNCIWLGIVTMTTVGYGDFSAKTNMGRIVSFVCSAWGTFIVSLIIVTLTDYLTPSKLETNAIVVINKVYSKKKLKKQSSVLLTKLMMVCNSRRKGEMIDLDEIEEIREEIKEFKDLHRDYHSIELDSNFDELLYRHSNFLEKFIDDVIEEQKEDIENQLAMMSKIGVSQHQILMLEQEFEGLSNPTNISSIKKSSLKFGRGYMNCE